SFSPAGPLANSGTIFFDAGGTLNVGTSLTLNSTSILEFNLAGLTQGTQYGKAKVTGALTVAGTLQVLLNPGYGPVLGDSFDLIDRGSISGTFSSLQLPVLGGSLGWDTSQLYSSGVISVGNVGFLAGDFNRDGHVNVADISAMQSALADLSDYQS